MYRTNWALMMKMFVKLRFRSVRKLAGVISQGFNQEFDRLDDDTDDEEYGQFLANEAADLSALKGEATPLILLMAYATYEYLFFLFVRRISRGPQRNDWSMAKKDLAAAGIPWSSLPEVHQLETMRLLVNCYKHANSIIDKPDLAERLQQERRTKVTWANVSYDDFITACEKMLTALADHIPQPTGR